MKRFNPNIQYGYDDGKEPEPTNVGTELDEALPVVPVVATQEIPKEPDLQQPIVIILNNQLLLKLAKRYHQLARLLKLPSPPWLFSQHPSQNLRLL